MKKFKQFLVTDTREEQGLGLTIESTLKEAKKWKSNTAKDTYFEATNDPAAKFNAGAARAANILLKTINSNLTKVLKDYDKLTGFMEDITDEPLFDGETSEIYLALEELLDRSETMEEYLQAYIKAGGNIK